MTKIVKATGAVSAHGDTHANANASANASASVAAAPLPDMAATGRRANDRHGRVDDRADAWLLLWALVAMAASAAGLWRYGAMWPWHEQLALPACAVASMVLAWHWPPLRVFFLASAAVTAAVIGTYLAGQASAVDAAAKPLAGSAWLAVGMGGLLLASTVAYWLVLAWPAGKARGLLRWHAIAGLLAWAGCALGLAASLVRWFESYRAAATAFESAAAAAFASASASAAFVPAPGHAPMSNLYEALLVLCWLTALLFLLYEWRYRLAHVGAFVMPAVGALVVFLGWYAWARQAHDAQPLIPALQSGWMKWHVGASLLGYGGFVLAGMSALAWLLQQWQCGRQPGHVRQQQRSGWLARVARRLPGSVALQLLAYRAIALGFAFFTLAIVLGAVWAAQAWGSYWSWDPKETWALVVWLNYAAWLHMQQVKGWRGAASAWWALLGLLLTGFAFMGVNLFFDGLHSYGQL